MNDIKRKRGRPTKDLSGAKRERVTTRVAKVTQEWLKREQRIRWARNGVRVSLGELVDELIEKFADEPKEIDL